MDFNLSDEHKMLARNTRDFMEKEIEPITDQIDREDKFPDWIWRRTGELGWLGITIPQRYGGTGFDYLGQFIIAEEIGRICPALAMSIITHSNLHCDNLYRHATEEQRRKYLPQLCTGEKIGALGLTEPNAGTDAIGGMQTTAKKDGKHYILNGTKMFITNGPVADNLIIYARTAPELGSKGITALIVERGFEGEFTARHLEKMGMRGSPTGELSFVDYRVPCENILGEENRGVGVMIAGLDIERGVLVPEAVGLIKRALELSLEYSRQRIQFGAPISTFQLVQAKLADMYAEMEACRWLSYRIAVLAGDPDRLSSAPDLHKLTAAACVIAGEFAMKAAIEAVQIHGGYGYMMEGPVNRLMRDAKLFQIGAGTTEIRRLIVARELLKTGI